MVNLTLIIYVAAGFILGFALARYTRQHTVNPKTNDEMHALQVNAREAVQERVADRRDQVLGLLRREQSHDAELAACSRSKAVELGITRKEVEQVLGVSASTAVRYLNQLEEEGFVQQVGETGRGVRYVLAE